MPSNLVLISYVPQPQLVVDQYTRALLHMNGADASTNIADETGLVWKMYGNAQLDTDQKVFGTSSLLLASSGDYITTPPCSFFDGDFTLELRIRFSSLPASGDIAGLFLQYLDVNNYNSLFVYNNAGTLEIYWEIVQAGNYVAIITRSFAFVINNWYHVAVTRAGNNTRLFVDGIQQGAEITSVYQPLVYPNPTYIGTTSPIGAGNDFHGWIDEVRISTGIARWSSDFGLPLAEYVYSYWTLKTDLQPILGDGMSYDPALRCGTDPVTDLFLYGILNRVSPLFVGTPGDIYPVGIASAEAFGQPSLKIEVSPAAIASAEAVGMPGVNAVMSLTGIASAEAVGAPTLKVNVSPTGIASAESFGIASAQAVLSGAGAIAGAEAFGVPEVVPVIPGYEIKPVGIVSAEAMGTPTLTVNVSPIGIVTAEAIGTASAQAVVTLAGIVSAEAIGKPSFVGVLSPVGIASAAAIGIAALQVTVSPTGIVSAQAMGTPSLAGVITIVGIVSAEAVGSPSLTVTISPVGIASAESFGIPIVSTGVYIHCVSINSAEAFGTPEICSFGDLVFWLTTPYVAELRPVLVASDMIDVIEPPSLVIVERK